MLDTVDFGQFSDTDLQVSKNWLAKYPRKRGIVSDQLREKLGATPDASGKFIRYEAHLNLSESNREIESKLLHAGFEPDDFVELFPVEYNRNYTFSFDISPDEDKPAHRATIVGGCKEAFSFLKSEEVWAFVEAERYPSANIQRYEVGSRENANGPTLSDFSILPMEVVHVPDVEDEQNEYGHTAHTHKLIDVHVKLSGIITPTSSFEPAASIDSKEMLAAALQSVGLYRITSVSGNTIYTAQFADGVKGNDFFKKLDALLHKCGFAQSMIVEPCFFFLRNKRGGRFAPVCPLLE